MISTHFDSRALAPHSTGAVARSLALWISLTSVAMSGGLLAWSAFAGLQASLPGFLSLATIGLLAGFVSGVISERSSFWLCAHFALAFWMGEITAIGPEAGLGHTVRQFIASIGALNFAPLLASLALPAGRAAVILKRHRH